MPVRSTVPVFLVLACCSVGRAAGAGPKKKKDDERTFMPHHSFTTPLEFTSLLDDWAVSGASIFERERLLLHPGVAERAGFVFNKMPMLTNNFEVVFHFKVVGEKEPTKVMPDQSFGFWYVYENISDVYNESKVIKAESWKQGLQEQDMTLGGMKALFEGLGVVLSMSDANKSPNPVVSPITNDGHTTLAWEHDLPAKDAKPMPFRNTINNAQLKIRVQPASIEAWLKQSPSLSWAECFKLDRSKHPIRVGGYMGFTAWSGTETEGAPADLVQITQVDVNNMDETVVGEDMKDVSARIQDAYREMLTDEKRHFTDQKSQTDHLARLTTMIDEHINSTAPAEQNLFQALRGLEHRMVKLSDDCKAEVKGARLLMGAEGADKGHKAGVESMKNEIIGLRRVLVKDSATHRQKLDAVQKNVAEVKEKQSKAVDRDGTLSAIAEQSKALEETVQSRGWQMSWMLFFLIAVVIVIGYLMHNRMTYYEKKHFI